MAEAQTSAVERKVSGTDDLFELSPAAIKKLETDEIVIGLCAPIGSPVHKVADEIYRLLRERYGYECAVIRLSRLIEGKAGAAPPNNGKYARTKYLIDKGNELRKKYGYSVLADLAISQMASDREKHKKAQGTPHYPTRRICYVLDSIKNADEMNILRRVYGEMFYFVGVFAPIEVRVQTLKDEGMQPEEVYRLIDRDSGEETAHGQSVRDTFPRADFFVRAGSGPENVLTNRLQRFLDLVLRAAVITPTVGETAMYQAASAAGSSACLSRQVGAAITDRDGEILAIGWNDVPRVGGGLYSSDAVHDSGTTRPDNRCYNWKGGKCFNDEEKSLLTREVVNTLIERGVIGGDQRQSATSAIERSRISHLIEFSRAIHAEMHALLSASQAGGQRVRDGALYCTTYPCHSCARHLIAAGVKDVYYIEPYRKSLATKLHDDSITEDEQATNKVRILSFDGVSPTRYLELFSMSKRKDGGLLLRSDPRTVHPVTSGMLESIPALEGLVVESLRSRKLLET